MKKLLLGITAFLALSASAHAETCKVTDPTGTPLNIRATPNGKIKNGTVIYYTDYQNDKKGRPWVLPFNAKGNKYIGWVYREFVSYY